MAPRQRGNFDRRLNALFGRYEPRWPLRLRKRSKRASNPSWSKPTLGGQIRAALSIKVVDGGQISISASFQGPGRTAKSPR